MAGAYIPSDLAGGFSYKPVSFNFGATDQTFTGGYTFDLPLATVASFTNAALDFNKSNSDANRGFMSGVINQSQNQLTGITGQAFDLQKYAIQTVDTMQQRSNETQRYAIKKAASSGGCFITTAVTKAKNLPDDCADLQALRLFRDEYMLSTDAGKALVKQYYEVAPKIVEALTSNPLANSIYARLDSLFIQPALHRIGTGELDIAQGIYTALVIEAARLAGVPFELSTEKVEKKVCTCKAPKNASPSFHAKTCPSRG